MLLYIYYMHMFVCAATTPRQGVATLAALRETNAVHGEASRGEDDSELLAQSHRVPLHRSPQARAHDAERHEGRDDARVSFA